MSKFYAIAMSAFHTPTNQFQLVAGHCVMDDEKEAKTFALGIANGRFPVSDGYAGHAATAHEVQREALANFLAVNATSGQKGVVN